MDIKVGKVTHYYDRIGVAVLDLSGDLKVGDTVLILGRTTEFTQQVASMEIEHQKVQSVGPGMEVALRVVGPVRKGDAVYIVTESSS
jgi:putative protease